MTRELTPETVMTLGGWDRRYARVLTITIEQGFGVALIDTNGDEANIDVEEYWRSERGEWAAGSSSGPVGTDIGCSGWAGTRTDNDAGYVRYAYGRAAKAGPQTVAVPAWHQDIDVVVAEGGWWVWVEPIRTERA